MLAPKPVRIGQHLRALPRRADRRNVVFGVARRHARRAARAPREIDRHRPAALRHAAPVIGIVHADVLGCSDRRVALRVVRDRRAKPGRNACDASPGISSVCRLRGAAARRRRDAGDGIGLGRRSGRQLTHGQRPRDPTTVLPCRAFGRNEQRMVPALADPRLRHVSASAPARSSDAGMQTEWDQSLIPWHTVRTPCARVPVAMATVSGRMPR